VTGYPEVLRKGFGIGEEMLVLCGMAIGWPEEENRVNELEVPRNDLEEQVVFLEE
jgi:nitroreductase